MTPSVSGSEQRSKSTTQSTTKLAIYTVLWVLSMAIATFGPLLVWDNRVLTIVAIGANLLIGFGVVAANIQALRGADEMMRQIQLEAMAFSLGVGVVVGLSYSLLDITDVVPFDAEIGHLVMLIGLTFLGALGIQLRRYR